jgi:hypothetical protein
VIWVNTLSRTTPGAMGMGGAGICHIQREGLRFLVPVGQEGKLRGSVDIGKLIISQSPVCIFIPRVILGDITRLPRGCDRNGIEG